MEASILYTRSWVNPSEREAEEFHTQIASAKTCGVEDEISRRVYKTAASRSFGAYVHAYETEEYKEMKLFLLETDSSSGRREAVATQVAAEAVKSTTNVGGLAVKSDGEIVSVFKNPELRSRGSALDVLLPLAIQNGGKYLDCFDGFLPTLYAKYGFVPVARLKFNREFAPDDWNYERDGTPDIIFMSHDGSTADEVINRLAEYHIAAQRKGYLEEVAERVNLKIRSLPYVEDYQEGLLSQIAYSS